MQDITSHIEAAMSKDVLWSVSEFFGAVDFLQADGLEISEWEDRENWVTASKGKDIVLYLWKQYPVIFIKKTDTANFDKLI